MTRAIADAAGLGALATREVATPEAGVEVLGVTATRGAAAGARIEDERQENVAIVEAPGATVPGRGATRALETLGRDRDLKIREKTQEKARATARTTAIAKVGDALRVTTAIQAAVALRNRDRRREKPLDDQAQVVAVVQLRPEVGKRGIPSAVQVTAAGHRRGEVALQHEIAVFLVLGPDGVIAGTGR